MALEITDSNFDELLAQNDVVVVDFWAQWCGPCRVLGPIIDDLAKANDGTPVGKVNVDDNPELTTKFGIRGIPAVLFFKGGELVNKLTGVQTKSALQGAIDKLKN